MQAVRTIATQDRAPAHVIEAYDLKNWWDQTIRKAWLEHCWSLLNEYLESLPVVVELPITRSEIDFAVELMARFALRSQDAIHLATALHYQIPVFWTCDEHFRRVNDIFVEVIRDQ
jgi:predicted nucleic acid-binding protein